MTTNSPRPPVVLVTGASSGIGKACAEGLFARGCRVYGTSRHAPRALVEARTTDFAPTLRMIPLDVTSDASVEAAVGIVFACEGRIDAVVNNAGFGIAGAAERTTLEEAHEQFETNFFGTVRVCRAVLPVMRQQGSGRVINVSSIAGRVAVPFQAFYSASKFAVEGYTTALRMEVAPFGIQVVLIAPGDFKTGFTAARKRVGRPFTPRRCSGCPERGYGAPESKGRAGADSPGLETRPTGDAYAEAESRALAVMEHDETHGATPEAVARLVYRVMTMRSPGVRYAVGPIAERLTLILQRLLPSRVFAWVIAKYYRVR